MKKTLPRLHAHLFSTKTRSQRAFPAATLQAIQDAIGAGEKQHRAQIRVIIEPSLALASVLHKVHPRVRAHQLFSQYQVWDTEENCGVLLYINLADHQVEIIADRGVVLLLKDAEWHAICDTMTSGFAHQEFHHSTLAALQQLNALLKVRFPNNGVASTELPDQPIVL